MNNSPRRGRRAGGGDTREIIRAAALSRFRAEGYQSVTLRDVASDAGVDVALIGYYFGSKQGLFTAAMALPINPADAVAAQLEGDPDELAERLLRTLLATWESPEVGGQMQAIATMALADPKTTALISDGIANEVVERLAAHLGEPNGLSRAAAATTLTIGLIVVRYLLKLEPMTSMAADDVVRVLAPQLQRALSG